MKKLAAFALAAACLGAAPFARAEVAVGQPAPDFTLTDTNGKKHSLSSFKGKYVVLEWNNPDCPFVVKHYASNNMQAMQKAYTGKGVVWLTINSGAPGKEGVYPAAEINKMTQTKGAAQTAYLLDGDGKVGKAYGAKNTPQMFVITPTGTIVYMGAIDSIRSANQSDIAKATNYVKAALDASMEGKAVPTPVSQPYGCSVKY
ncbi:alkyl hydroperoxide reductase [Verrucomicrobia bacterium SCGC AG-212-E04]|nr:alkyl hydroperoxide reductase [Verrucomicrobia bacterium SCGC AG-212-E04]